MKVLNVALATAIATLAGAALPSVASAGTTIVKIVTDEASGDLIFEPAQINIQPGDTVVWVQADADNEHNVAAYPDKIPEGTSPFVSPMMGKAGESWVMTFDTKGSYFYHCHPHEAVSMKGLIVVGRASLPEEFRKSQDGDMNHAQHGDGGHGDTGSDMADMMDKRDGHMKNMMDDKGGHMMDGDDGHQGKEKPTKMKMEDDRGHHDD